MPIGSVPARDEPFRVFRLRARFRAQTSHEQHSLLVLTCSTARRSIGHHLQPAPLSSCLMPLFRLLATRVDSSKLIWAAMAFLRLLLLLLLRPLSDLPASVSAPLRCVDERVAYLLQTAPGRLVATNLYSNAHQWLYLVLDLRRRAGAFWHARVVACSWLVLLALVLTFNSLATRPKHPPFRHVTAFAC